MRISPYNLLHMESFRDSEKFCSSNKYDLFISAYTDEEIVKNTYDNIEADKKLWLIFPEYELDLGSISGEKFNPTLKDDNTKEADYIKEMYHCYIAENRNKKICIDTTGFNKPYLIYLIIF